MVLGINNGTYEWQVLHAGSNLSEVMGGRKGVRIGVGGNAIAAELAG